MPGDRAGVGAPDGNEHRFQQSATGGAPVRTETFNAMTLSRGRGPPPVEQSVGTRTLRGMLWGYGSYGGGRALVFVATAILAHLLSPKDCGLVALATLASRRSAAV